MRYTVGASLFLFAAFSASESTKTAGSEPTPTPTPALSSPDVYAFLQGLNTSPDGYVHIADDGVARAYDGQDQVIDYRRLSNAQLMQYLLHTGPMYADYMDHLHDVFDAVDGNQVTDATRLMDPPASLRVPADSRDIPEPTSNPKPRNNLEVAAEQKRDNNYCLGIACQYSVQCITLGCNGCVFIDSIVPGGGGSCY